jgi:hypothetical protein
MKTYDVTIHSTEVFVVQLEALSRQDAKFLALAGDGDVISTREENFTKCHKVEEVEQQLDFDFKPMEG